MHLRRLLACGRRHRRTPPSPFAYDSSRYRMEYLDLWITIHRSCSNRDASPVRRTTMRSDNASGDRAQCAVRAFGCGVEARSRPQVRGERRPPAGRSSRWCGRSRFADSADGAGQRAPASWP
ncbi:hypothetical protein FM112_04180 [Gulosibacter sp. 10]|nr:hypothetical protein FM112_04180 [Gulosibacter sp. 10]